MPSSFARNRVDFFEPHPPSQGAAGPGVVEGGESILTFTDLVAYVRARFNIEEGQTMAEYGVVLAVITGLVVIAIGLLSGAIAAALDTVRGYL